MEKSTGSRQEGDQKQKKKKMTIYTVNKIQEPKKPEEEPPKDTKVKVTPEQVGEFIGTVFLTPLVLMVMDSPLIRKLVSELQLHPILLR